VPNRFTPDEFGQLMRPWDPGMREIAEERMQTSFSRPVLQEFSADEAAIMRAALDRLIPQQEGVDLVGFTDAYIDKPLGRGDKKPGMPQTKEVIHLGLEGISEMAQSRHGKSFVELTAEQQDAVLREIQEGKAKGGVWDKVPSDYFFERFYGKALHGYFAHPRVWMRIGFMGASYPEGYRWLGRGQVKQRHERTIGWEIM
jgi:hypothetical protein